MASLKPGAKAKVSYVRSGKEGSTSVTIADRAKLFSDRTGEEDEEADNTPAPDTKFGVTVRNVTPDIASRLDIPANKGVIVQDVKPGSFSEDVGLSRGDVILEINRQPVNSEDDFRKVQGTLKSGQ